MAEPIIPLFSVSWNMPVIFCGSYFLPLFLYKQKYGSGMKGHAGSGPNTEFHDREGQISPGVNQHSTVEINEAKQLYSCWGSGSECVQFCVLTPQRLHRMLIQY